MLTDEGADDRDVIIRPAQNGAWQVEFPGSEGVTRALAPSEYEAIVLARQFEPGASIRFLPAR